MSFRKFCMSMYFSSIYGRRTSRSQFKLSTSSYPYSEMRVAPFIMFSWLMPSCRSLTRVLGNYWQGSFRTFITIKSNWRISCIKFWTIPTQLENLRSKSNKKYKRKSRVENINSSIRIILFSTMNSRNCLEDKMLKSKKYASCFRLCTNT